MLSNGSSSGAADFSPAAGAAGVTGAAAAAAFSAAPVNSPWDGALFTAGRTGANAEALFSVVPAEAARVPSSKPVAITVTRISSSSSSSKVAPKMVRASGCTACCTSVVCCGLDVLEIHVL